MWTAQLTTTSVLLLNSDKLDVDAGRFWIEYLLAGVLLAALHGYYVLAFIRVRNRGLRLGPKL